MKHLARSRTSDERKAVDLAGLRNTGWFTASRTENRSSGNSQTRPTVDLMKEDPIAAAEEAKAAKVKKPKTSREKSGDEMI